MLYYAVKDFLRRKKLFLLNVSTIALVALMVVVLPGLGEAYRTAARLPFQAVQGTIIIQKNGNVPEEVSGVLLSCSLAPISQETVTGLSSIGGVNGVSTAISLWVFDPDHFKRVVGVDWQDGFGRNLASKIVQGSAPAGSDGVLLDENYAGQHSLGTGAEVEAGGRTFTVTGIIRNAGNEIVGADMYVGLGTAQEMAVASANLQAVETFAETDVNIIFLDTGQSDVAAVSNQVKAFLGGGASNAGQTPLGQTVGSYNIYTPASFDSQVSSLFKLSDRLAFIILALVLAAGALIVVRGVLHETGERRREYGIMKSVGFRNRDVRHVLFLETSMQAAAGLAIGLLASALIIVLLGRTTVSIAIPWELTAYPHFLVSNPALANVVQTYPLPIGFGPLFGLVAGGIALALGGLTGLFGAWRLNRVKPMEVLKYE
jgi:ABC-type antimicrobial peptide transport system permease subunit